MTDTSTILKNAYNGNGSTTNFDYQFKILDGAELIVVRTDSLGADHVLTLDTDYQLTGIGENNGGQITYPISGIPLAKGERITLYPLYSLTQTIDFTNQDKAYFELFEEGLDRANFKIKMLQEQIDRSIKIGITSDIDPEDYLTQASNYAATASSAANTASSNASTASQAAINATNAASSVNIPTSLTGEASNFLKVKVDESGYEFTSSAPALKGDTNTFTANQTINAEMDADLIKLDGTDISTYLAQGQCRLEYASATELKLERYNGQSLLVWNGTDKWVPTSIPTSGISYTIPAGLSANTLYYLYAYINNGSIAFASSVSAPTSDTDTGFMIMPTTDKYLCVGMYYLNASKQLDDKYMVSSYFNRKRRTKQAALSADVSTTSGSFIEASTDLRCPFLVWNNDEASAALNAMQHAAGGGVITELFLALDGSSTSHRFSSFYKDVNDSYHLHDMIHIMEPIADQSQGYHYATVAYATSHAGSFATTLHGSSGRTSNLNITTMG
jgi:hypothetical protein